MTPNCKGNVLFGAVAVITGWCGSAVAQTTAVFAEETIAMRVDGQLVVGTYAPPKHVGPGRAGPGPAVLLLHGMSGNREGPRVRGSHLGLFAFAARRWARRGLASLRISTRGRGGSEGDFRNMTLERRVAEGRRAIDWLARQPTVDATRLFVLGHSQGSIIAAAVAARARDAGRIKALVLWAPQASALRAYRYSMGVAAYERALKAPPDEVISWIGAGGRVRSFRPAFFLGLSKIDTVADVSAFAGPVLIITGRRDRWSSPMAARQFARTSQDLTFSDFAVGHRMGASMGREVTARVVGHSGAWMMRHAQ